MRIICALLRLCLIAVFLAALGTAAPVLAAPSAAPSQSADCAQHMGGMPPLSASHQTDPAAPEGCLHHCLATSLTPDPVQPPARAERLSRLFPPAVLSLLALVTPEPEAPPPRA